MFLLCRMSFHWPQWLSLCYFSQIQSEQAIFHYKSTTAILDLSHQAVRVNSDLRDMKYMLLCCYSLQPKLVCTRKGHHLHIPKLFTLYKYLGRKINKEPTWEEKESYEAVASQSVRLLSCIKDTENAPYQAQCWEYCLRHHSHNMVTNKM